MKAFFPALLVALAAAPFVQAHDPAGTPRNYCEDPSEWVSHDYGAGAIGTFAFAPTDGNLAGDCDGDTVPADYDLHNELATGGAFLMTNGGDGVTSGSIACYGALAHHPDFGPISVFDVVFGGTLTFSVGIDTINIVPPTDPAAPNCGDSMVDQLSYCTNSCILTFPSGLDGTYYVFVGDMGTGSVGSVGHITSP